MTMFSFRVDEADAAAVAQWAGRLHIDRSELLRDALRRYLTALAAEHDIEAYAEHPLTPDERSFADVADWGPAEEWDDWADASR